MSSYIIDNALTSREITGAILAWFEVRAKWRWYADKLQGSLQSVVSS